jgi:Ca-activated chloride channel family protein
MNKLNLTHLILSAALALSASALFVGPPKPPAPKPLLSPGQMDTDSVRTDGKVRLKVHLSHAHPLEGTSVWAQIDVDALKGADLREVDDSQLVLVLDHSGSMSGEKMQHAKEAALQLIDLLQPTESLAVVAFDSTVDSTPLLLGTDGNKETLRNFVRNIYPNADTNISLGLETARNLLASAESHGTRRIILVSDGQPTAGLRDAGDLAALATRLRGEVGAVSALGVGVDFNGPLMTQLAESGGGFYGYLKDASVLTEVLTKELAQARHESLAGLELTLTTSGSARVADVAGRHFVTVGNATTLSLPSLAPGQNENVYVRLDTQSVAADFDFYANLKLREGDTVATALGHVRAATTEDPGLAKEGVDQKLADQGIRLLGTQQMVEAARAYQNGDRENAFALLDNARRLFGTSADALAGDINDLDSTKQRWAATTDRAGVNHEALQLEQKKMMNFGANNAY